MQNARRDDLVVFGAALLARLAAVAWAASRIPPAADGTYYQTLAERLAHGEGYTWLWPDGAVTYAAHYPVGYPAALGLIYAMFGAHPVLAMTFNACIGALGALATRGLVASLASPRRALLAGLFVALHPVLVPYTPALMTEGVTASLFVLAASLGVRGRFVPGALVLGVATLVRPQSILLAPIFGLLAAGEASFASRVRSVATATVLALAVCAPWTARNCVHMQRCALVSVNAGWNLLIGEQTDSGAWQEILVPAECREVWDEAKKDDCFAAAARREVLAHPVAWLGKMPKKLGVTFDYFGAAPWYLHLANPSVFTDKDKLALGIVETAAARIALIAALVAVAFLDGARLRARRVVALIGVLFALGPAGFVGYLALAAVILLRSPPRFAWTRAEMLLPWTCAVILTTAFTHAVFFGAGRYGVVVVPLVAAVAALGRGRSASPTLASESSSAS